MRIEIDDFSFDFFSTNVRLSILIFFEKVKLYIMQKNEFDFRRESKSWNLWALSVNFVFGAAQKKTDLAQIFATSWRLSIENLTETFGHVVTKQNQFEGQVFTKLIASFRGIGKSELQIKDRCISMCIPVCLLKCKRFDWHSDGTNQNWVGLD